MPEIHPQTLVIVRNPRARRAPEDAALLRDVMDHLVTAGWAVDIQTTRRRGEATELAQRAARSGVDVVAACGGDGTVNEVLSGLVGSETALAVVPAGTADVWAREAGVPRDVAGALALIPRARRVRVDVGRVRSDRMTRRFLLMCSLGIDAEVVRRVGSRSRLKQHLGRWWYGVQGAWALARSESVEASIEVDDERIEGALFDLVAGNTQLYGGVLRITSGARMDDGLLDVCSFSGYGLSDRAWLAWRAARGGLDQRAGLGVDYRRGRRIDVRTAHPVAVQADGEYVGNTPAIIEIEPQALTVLIAPEPNVLFGETD